MLHPRHARKVDALVRAAARKHEVRLERFANVGNHLHILVRPRTRKGFKAFTREICGKIAMLVTGACKTNPLMGKFWDFIPFTRIVNWGKDHRTIARYFIKNLFEAAGLLTRKAKAEGFEIISIAGWGAAPPGHKRN